MQGTAALASHKLAAPAHPAAHKTARTHHRPASSGLGFALTPTTSGELEEARAQAPNLPFPLEYPRARDSFAGAEPDELRLYKIHDLGGHLHPIYVTVISRGELGQYYDVQGTNWTDPPKLRNPGQTVQLGSRTYELFYLGEQVKTIAWREDGAVYWIENTLTDNVSPRAMLAMAEQTLPVIHTLSEPLLPSPTSAAAREVDLAPQSATQTSLTAKLEAALGFAGLGIVALLSLLVLVRQRELRRLRATVAQALALETHQRLLLAAAGLASVEPTLAGAGTRTGAPPLAERPPTLYQAARDWRRIVLAGALLAVVLAGAAVALLVH
jgi:hypothetical protein